MSHGRVEHHKDLAVWQQGVELVADVYSMSRELPADERFGLTSQMRRAAISVPANIAEGAARGSRAEFARFVLIARGSLAELETHLYVANRLGFVTEPQVLLDRVASLRGMLINLHRSLRVNAHMRER